MRVNKIAAKIVADINNPLNGMSKVKASRLVNKLLHKHTGGFFTDEHWEPIHKTFSELDRNNIFYDIKKTQYFKDDDGNPNRKEWHFQIPFINNRERENVLYGNIIASGAGRVGDPFSRYDVVAYVT